MVQKKICWLPGCEDRESIRHRIPISCNDIYDIWLKRISNPNLYKLSKEIVYRNYVICDKHFIDECKNLSSKRLKTYSLPSINLHGFNEEGTRTYSFAYPPSIQIQSIDRQAHQA